MATVNIDRFILSCNGCPAMGEGDKRCVILGSVEAIKKDYEINGGEFPPPFLTVLLLKEALRVGGDSLKGSALLALQCIAEDAAAQDDGIEAELIISDERMAEMSDFATRLKEARDMLGGLVMHMSATDDATDDIGRNRA